MTAALVTINTFASPALLKKLLWFSYITVAVKQVALSISLAEPTKGINKVIYLSTEPVATVVPVESADTTRPCSFPAADSQKTQLQGEKALCVRPPRAASRSSV